MSTTRFLCLESEFLNSQIYFFFFVTFFFAGFEAFFAATFFAGLAAVFLAAFLGSDLGVARPGTLAQPATGQKADGLRRGLGMA